MQHWLRKVRVIFSGAGSLVVNPGFETDNQITVSFDIQKSISGTANDAVVRIHNLSEASRNSIGREYTDITVEAGYIPGDGQDYTGVIFSGQIRDFEHYRNSTDIVTIVQAGDGDKAIRKTTISKTYPAGTNPEAVVEDVYAGFAEHGVKRGEWLFPPMDPFIRPYSICGGAYREINILGRGKKFYWSIQNQVMEVIPHDGFLPLATAVNKNTGMLDDPRLTDNGVKIRSLINPEVRPNRKIKVESERVKLNADNGEYRVGRIDYQGDNRSGTFEMIIHGESIIGGVVNEGEK